MNKHKHNQMSQQTLFRLTHFTEFELGQYVRLPASVVGEILTKLGLKDLPTGLLTVAALAGNYGAVYEFRGVPYPIWFESALSKVRDFIEQANVEQWVKYHPNLVAKITSAAFYQELHGQPMSASVMAKWLNQEVLWGQVAFTPEQLFAWWAAQRFLEAQRFFGGAR